MAGPDQRTVGEQLYWAYANLAMAHAACTDGSVRYGTLHYQIRAKLYARLRDGSMRIGSLLDDERWKMLTSCCVYCGGTQGLSLDHLVSRLRGGEDAADNIVWACRSCNSSKGGRDLFEWWAQSRGDGLPPLMIIRRYLKLAIRQAERQGLLDEPVTSVDSSAYPFRFDLIPTRYSSPRDVELVRSP